MSTNLLPVTKIQKFSTRDGPGIRTTVFLKGCPLRCKWCHNPETQSADAELFYTEKLCIRCGICQNVCSAGVHKITETEHRLDRNLCNKCMKCTDLCPSGALESCSVNISIEDILDEVLKDKEFYGGKGGITLSGGEPMLYAKKSCQLLGKSKKAGICTALETCGYFNTDLLCDIVPVTDLFLWDIKDTNDSRHVANTGKSNAKILANLKKADDMGAVTRLRCIMISSVNMELKHYQEIAKIFMSLKNCEGVELIPYHSFGGAKEIQLGRTDSSRSDWIPDNKEILKVKNYLKQYTNILD